MNETDALPLLAPFCGTRPQAPAWFHEALAQAPQRRAHVVDGAAIETLVWGQRGRPGLLLLHGNAAHADWWSFVAPFFLPEYRVVALSWSGMGGSDWRAAYSMDGFVAEAQTVAQAEGLFDAPVGPVVVGHSFGGVATAGIAARLGERLRAAVLLDAPLMSAEERRARRERRGPWREPRAHRVYPTEAAALMRFRLLPAQACENLFAVDYIARHGLRPIAAGEGPEGTGPGFSWRFDPFIWDHYRHGDPAVDLPGARCPVAIMYAENSRFIATGAIDFQRRLAPAGSPVVAIPAAEHHLMLDQPLAFVAALRALLAGWPGRP